MTRKALTWKTSVLKIVQNLPKNFSLSDVLDHKEHLNSIYPNNRFVEEKIRQSLQILRNQGSIQFLGKGHYQRLDVAPVFSPLIDDFSANLYVGATQISRIKLETWAQFNLYCINCLCDSLEPLPSNTPVKDFTCLSCRADYQIKSRNGRFGNHIIGGAYEPTLLALREARLPDFVLIEFDVRYATVVFVDAIPGDRIDETRLVSRAPLRPSARRAGWRGFKLRVDGLPRVRLVQPQGNDRATVHEQWAKLKSG